jgi:DnaJ homolog subfamily C member 28
MPINVTRQLQEAMERGDFDDLPGKGKPQHFDDNPHIPPNVRMVNRMLKENGFAPRWIEVDKEIRAEKAELEKLLTNIIGRRRRLATILRAQPLRRDSIRRSFELERRRALEKYTHQLKDLNQKLQRFNLMTPMSDKQQPLYNLDAAIARFHEKCPSL